MTTTIINDPATLVGSETRRGIGLCYFDPSVEQLIEFNTSQVIEVAPFEEGVRRFYLIRTDSSLVPTYAYITITGSNTSLTIKAKDSELFSEVDAFINIPPDNTAVVNFSRYSNWLVPIDVYIRSNNPIKSGTTLNIKIEVLFS